MYESGTTPALLTRPYVGFSPTTPQSEAGIRMLPPVSVLPLDRFADGIELYRRGDALKVVFRP